MFDVFVVNQIFRLERTRQRPDMSTGALGLANGGGVEDGCHVSVEIVIAEASFQGMFMLTSDLDIGNKSDGDGVAGGKGANFPYSGASSESTPCSCGVSYRHGDNETKFSDH